MLKEQRKNVKEIREDKNEERNQKRWEYIKKWNGEQERLKKQLPEEKAFRCYRCYFSVYYLLRVGYTNFLGKGWLERSAIDKGNWFKEFDNKLSKENFKLVDNLIKEITEWFKNNINEIWCPREIYKKYLPRKEHFSPLFDGASSQKSNAK